MTSVESLGEFMDMRYSLMISRYIGKERVRTTTGERQTYPSVADVVGGIYVAALERVQQFWSSWEHFERVAMTDCNVTMPRWMYWQLVSQALRRQALRDRLFAGFVLFSEGRGRNQELLKAEAQAHEVCRRRLRHSAELEAFKYTPKDFLFAIASDRGSQLGISLRDSGINLELLENEVRVPGQ
jgi:hypothetical protein